MSKVGVEKVRVSMLVTLLVASNGGAFAGSARTGLISLLQGGDMSQTFSPLSGISAALHVVFGGRAYLSDMIITIPT